VDEGCPDFYPNTPKPAISLDEKALGLILLGSKFLVLRAWRNETQIIMNAIEIVLGVVTGIALSATCGMRVFVPVFGVSVAALTGHLDLADGLAWLGSPVVAISAGVAMLAEIVAFYVPWLDHALDGIAAPLAVVAGTILTASQIHDVSPYLQWALAIVAGGGTATIFQTKTMALRATSTLGTGGIANPVVSTAETCLAATGTILTLVLGWLAGLVFVVLCGWLGYRFVRWFGRRFKSESRAH
jgi:hypothetical protein